MNQPCPQCGRMAEERFCRTCPVNLSFHLRHDNDPKIIGNSSGVCPTCEKDPVRPGTVEFSACACGYKLEDQEARMRKVVEEERMMGRSWKIDSGKEREE